MRSEGDNALGSICPSVCLFGLSQLNRLTYDLHLLGDSDSFSATKDSFGGTKDPFSASNLATPW